MTSEVEGLRSELVALGREAFSFLESAGADVEFEAGANRSVLVYVLGPGAFEVEYDWHEQAVFLLVCRALGGRRSEGYYVHEGRRARVHLYQALEDVGAADEVSRERLRAVARRSGGEAMVAQIRTLAAVLAEHLAAMFDQWDAIFPPIPG